MSPLASQIKEDYGRIRVVIQYERCDEAKIILTSSSFFEFDTAENLQLLGEISQRAANVVFEIGEDGTIQMKVCVEYFEDAREEDGVVYDELARKSVEILLGPMGAE